MLTRQWKQDAGTCKTYTSVYPKKKKTKTSNTYIKFLPQNQQQQQQRGAACTAVTIVLSTLGRFRGGGTALYTVYTLPEDGKKTRDRSIAKTKWSIPPWLPYQFETSRLIYLQRLRKYEVCNSGTHTHQGPQPKLTKNSVLQGHKEATPQTTQNKTETTTKMHSFPRYNIKRKINTTETRKRQRQNIILS